MVQLRTRAVLRGQRQPPARPPRGRPVRRRTSGSPSRRPRVSAGSALRPMRISFAAASSRSLYAGSAAFDKEHGLVEWSLWERDPAETSANKMRRLVGLSVDRAGR